MILTKQKLFEHMMTEMRARLTNANAGDFISILLNLQYNYPLQISEFVVTMLIQTEMADIMHRFVSSSSQLVRVLIIFKILKIDQLESQPQNILRRLTTFMMQLCLESRIQHMFYPHFNKYFTSGPLTSIKMFALRELLANIFEIGSGQQVQIDRKQCTQQK